MSSSCERVEEINVEMVCHNVTKDVAKTVKKLFPDSMAKHDPELTIHFSFNFWVEYFNVVKYMEAIEALLDTGKVKMVSTKELRHSKSLAQDFFNKIEKLERRIKENLCQTSPQ